LPWVSRRDVKLRDHAECYNEVGQSRRRLRDLDYPLALVQNFCRASIGVQRRDNLLLDPGPPQLVALERRLRVRILQVDQAERESVRDGQGGRGRQSVVERERRERAAVCARDA
jgi:hypothetical protein